MFPAAEKPRSFCLCTNLSEAFKSQLTCTDEQQSSNSSLSLSLSLLQSAVCAAPPTSSDVVTVIHDERPIKGSVVTSGTDCEEKSNSDSVDCHRQKMCSLRLLLLILTSLQCKSLFTKNSA